MVLGIAALEIHHRVRYGRFVGYGIHVDVVESSGDIGVPGIKTFYAAQVSNYTLFPLKLVGWEYRSDFLGAPPSFGCRFQIQKLSPQDGHWITVMDFKPAGTSQFPVLIKTLYPLGSIVPMERLPAAVDSLRKGDRVRFAVFTTLPHRVQPYTPSPFGSMRSRRRGPPVHPQPGKGRGRCGGWRISIFDVCGRRS